MSRRTRPHLPGLHTGTQMELQSFHPSGSRANGAEHTSTGEIKSAWRTCRTPSLQGFGQQSVKCNLFLINGKKYKQSPVPVCIIQVFPGCVD